MLKNKLYLHFMVFFLIGGCLIGLLETLFYYQLCITENESFYRWVPVISFIGLTYTFFSYLSVINDLKSLPKHMFIKLFMVIYFLGFVFCITYYRYTSPLSFVVNRIFNGVVADKWNMDIKQSYQHQLIEKIKDEINEKIFN